MAVVIRLEGLPVVAGSADIRRFFSGLNIPDGGVHIIGGEKGEAFIIFATDEDARRGMSFSGRFINGSRIELFLSSKTEMQHIMEVSRERFDHGGRETVSGSRRAGSSNSGVGNFSNLVAGIKKGMGKLKYGSLKPLGNDFHSAGSQNSDVEVSESADDQFKKKLTDTVFVRGLPYVASEDDVVNFFSGLQVEKVKIMENDGRPSGNAVVKFATPSDAKRGLQCNMNYMGSRYIEVLPVKGGALSKFGEKSDEKTEHSFPAFAQLNQERSSSFMSSRKQSSSRSPPGRFLVRSHSRSPPGRFLVRSHSRSPPGGFLVRSHSRSPPGRLLFRSHSRSPPGRFLVRSHSRSPPRRFLAHSRSRSPRRFLTRSRSRSPPRRAATRSRSGSLQRSAAARSPSPFSHSTLSLPSNGMEFYIHVQNLPPAVEKRDLRVFFGALDIPNHRIMLLDQDHNYDKTREAFVLFRSSVERKTALTYHKECLFAQEVHIVPTSKKNILEIIESSRSKKSSERHHHVKERKNRSSGPKTCVYLRNLPFDVTKVEVKTFFAEFNLYDSDIDLLYDDKGIGLGEALVKFRSEERARKAESLNGRRFLGTEVLVRCITEEQMQEFGIHTSSVSSEKIPAHSHARGDHFYAVGSPGPSIPGNLKHPSDNRYPDDFLCSPDGYRGPPPFPDYLSESNPGSFHEGHFVPDSNLSGGSDRFVLINLKNIPFRAAPNEILDFFHGYKVIPESLFVHNNEHGNPSGEATLALENYDEAVAAINELNGRPFGHRKVTLSLA